MQDDIIFVEDSSPAPKNSRWRIWLAVGGAALLLCAAVFIGAVIFTGSKLIQRFVPQTIQTAEERPYIGGRANTLGDPNAPVHIIEYVDFQCVYCRKFWAETEPLIIEEYVNTGKVYLEYRAYAFMGQESIWAAEGAYCAGDQNKFWEYHDALFTNWTGKNVGDFSHVNLISYAKSINLDVEQFTTCLSKEKHKATVELDALSAKEHGVSATPTLIINGVKVEGALPFQRMREIIEHVLNGSMETQDL